MEQKDPLEIERKYLIRYPDPEVLEQLCSHKYVICQIYLKKTASLSRRIRSMETDGQTRYWYTEKEKISDITRIEREREITKEEYETLAVEMIPGSKRIHKTRYVVPAGEVNFEIDIFPEWKSQAFAEVELTSEEQEIHFPDFLDIIREVTSDGRYTNSSLARNGFPEEETTSVK